MTCLECFLRLLPGSIRTKVCSRSKESYQISKKKGVPKSGRLRLRSRPRFEQVCMSFRFHMILYRLLLFLAFFATFSLTLVKRKMK